MISYVCLVIAIKIVQRYEKSRAKQRNSFLFLPRQSNFTDLLAKIQKSKQNAKEMLVFLSFSSGSIFGIILKYEKPWEIQRFFLRQTKRLLRYYLHRHLDAEESSVVSWSSKGKVLSCNHIGIKKQKEAKDRLYFFLFSSFCFP